MDFFNKALSSATKSEEHNGAEEDKSHAQAKKHSATELFSSAEVVAGAARATFANQSDKVDKGKVAGAGADLLGGAKEYGKLEEDKGLGKYVGQAETYLHSYGSSGGKTVLAVDHDDPPAADAPAKVAVVEEEKKVVEEEEKKDGGGAGDYFKMAEGLLK